MLYQEGQEKQRQKDAEDGAVRQETQRKTKDCMDVVGEDMEVNSVRQENEKVADPEGLLAVVTPKGKRRKTEEIGMMKQVN